MRSVYNIYIVNNNSESIELLVNNNLRFVLNVSNVIIEDDNIPLSFKYLILNETFDSSILMAEYNNKLMLTFLSKNQKCFGYMLSKSNDGVLAKSLRILTRAVPTSSTSLT